MSEKSHIPTEVQTQILENLYYGRNPFHGMPSGRSHAGGWDTAFGSLLRRGYIWRQQGVPHITDAGRAALLLAKTKRAKDSLA